MDGLILHAQAALAAQQAVDAALEQHGRDNAAWLYCGFAWVTIKPARGKFVNELKRNRIGNSGTYGGWTVSSNAMFNVDGTLCQSMELKEIAARAYANVLSDNGVSCSVNARAD